MAEEIDDSGFYRQDFSTVSDWEVFIAQLGETIQKLTLSEIDLPSHDNVFDSNWKLQTETILLQKEKIVVSSYVSTNEKGTGSASAIEKVANSFYEDLMNVKNTFGPPLKFQDFKSTHIISCMFGLSRFVVIHPYQQRLSNPSEVCTFLSAANVVAAEYCPLLPVFVQLYEPKLNIFVGVGSNTTHRTNFDIVSLKYSPTDCRYLSGLLTIFKEKLPRNVPTITVSVRNTYFLQPLRIRFPMSIPFRQFPDEQNDMDTNYIKSTQFIALPSGYFPYANTEVYLVYTWLDISENFALDSPHYTDFVPSKTQNCKMHQVTHAFSYMSSCLRDFLKLLCMEDTLESLAGRRSMESSGEENMAKALRNLTDPQHRHFRSVGSTEDNKLKTLKTISGPLQQSELKAFMSFLFPDLYPADKCYTYADDILQEKGEIDPHRIKSAPLDSLCSRLSCLLATCNAHFGGKSGLAQLYFAFIRELRFIWNFRLPISGVSATFPDTRTCLLNQKLQMLSYCIDRSIFGKYEKKQPLSDNNDMNESSTSDASFKETSKETDDEDEDEFYDCAEYAPEGRCKRLDDKKLLGCDEPLYVPITQDPVPKTEDELQEDAEAMLKHGSGSDLSMQLMCSSLLSDMEAFKAANPNGKLEDFIRWYSPRDWEEDDSGLGKLSARMEAPGNTWQKMWQDAKPVPAYKQKRLFDETTEGEKVMSYLESRNINEISKLVIITVLHAAIIKFKDVLETEKIFDIFEIKVDELLADLCHLSRNEELFNEEISSIEDATAKIVCLIEKLEKLEAQFFQFKCFERLTGSAECITFGEVKQKFQETIENGNSCNIANTIGQHIIDSNESEMQKCLITKEYVLRAREELSGCPHYLRAIVVGEEVRLCGAFTEHTTFI
ncbi:rab3 GTPase-activating protein catalytic subunit [Ceratitis capitata]|uniref:rab3 GTPase-activating protein catalytic subunit n=1 Tax=Ceratitis capitata TaxID=7213 RepID=UPI00032A09F8|nr:rab3 GTPase-activating protein catalytic subunit [Ceratitis capitata]